jgi:hypothetical protein
MSIDMSIKSVINAHELAVKTITRKCSRLQLKAKLDELKDDSPKWFEGSSHAQYEDDIDTSGYLNIVDLDRPDNSMECVGSKSPLDADDQYHFEEETTVESGTEHTHSNPSTDLLSEDDEFDAYVEATGGKISKDSRKGSGSNTMNTLVEFNYPDAPILCRSFTSMNDLIQSVDLAIPGFRIVEEAHEKYAQFHVRLSINRKHVTHVWRRHNEFAALVSAIRDGMLGNGPFDNSLMAWDTLMESKSLFRNLSLSYLRVKQICLEDFIRHLLNEIDNADDLLYFLEDSPSKRRSFMMSYDDYDIKSRSMESKEPDECFGCILSDINPFSLFC